MLTMMDYSSITTYIDLEVALPPSVSLTIPDDYLSDNHSSISLPERNISSHPNSSVPKMFVEEGQSYNITCTARRVYPRPVFYWTVDYKYSPQIHSVHDHPTIIINSSTYFITSYHTITLSSSRMLNNSLLTCHVMQHHTRTGRLLGRTNKSVLLHVLPALVLPLPSPAQTGIRLAVLILVLIFLLALAGK